MRYEFTLVTGTCCSGKIIYNYFYPSHSNNGNIHVMHIHLPERHYGDMMSTIFVHKSYSFWAFSRRYGSCQFDFTRSYRLELHLDRLSLVYQQGCLCQQALRKTWVLSSLKFEFLHALELTCLHPYASYTNFYILKCSSFRSLWRQSQNKSRN